MDWIILTERDLFDLLNKSQLDLLKAEAVKANDSGICNRIIDMVAGSYTHLTLPTKRKV